MMKKRIATFLTLVLVISGMVFLQPDDTVQAASDTWDGTVDTDWYTSNETATEYTLTTAEQLAGLASLVNNWTNFAGKTIKLGADIVLNEGDEADWAKAAPANKWTPIGDGKGSGTGHTFRGVFDGAGHQISGMYLESASNYQQGLFGVVAYVSASFAAPAIRNVSVVNSYIKNPSAEKVGMLVGQLYVANAVNHAEICVENIYLQGTVASTYSNARIGGVCGMMNLQTPASSTARFKNIVSDVDVFSTTTKMLGGIVSCNTAATTYAASNDIFENCVNLGDLISDWNGSTVGGLYGNTSNHANVTIINCVNAGRLKGQKVGAALGSVSMNVSSAVTVRQFINVAEVDYVTSTYKSAGAIYGGGNINSVVAKTFEQCYSVPIEKIEEAAECDKSVLTGTDALTTLAANGFETENWTMVAGIAPLPKENARMCGFMFDKASLTLYSSMQINFKVLKNSAKCYGLSKVVFALNGDTKEVTDYVEDGDYYVYSLSDISPYQMGEVVSATLYGNYDSEAFCGETRKISVSDYCYALLNHPDYAADSYAKLRTLIVDLLNYGTESQIRDGRTENYVNANLTEQQKAMASADRVLSTVKNIRYETIGNPGVMWKAAGLNLKEKVVIRLKFCAENTEGLFVQFKDNKGNILNVTEFTAVTGEENCYYVYMDKLNAYQMSEAIYATVYNAENEAVSDTLCYSIESYAYDAQNVETGNLGSLVKAMIRYGNSANAYQQMQ